MTEVELIQFRRLICAAVSTNVDKMPTLTEGDRTSLAALVGPMREEIARLRRDVATLSAMLGPEE